MTDNISNTDTLRWIGFQHLSDKVLEFFGKESRWSIAAFLLPISVRLLVEFPVVRVVLGLVEWLHRGSHVVEDNTKRKDVSETTIIALSCYVSVSFRSQISRSTSSFELKLIKAIRVTKVD